MSKVLALLPSIQGRKLVQFSSLLALVQLYAILQFSPFQLVQRKCKNFKRSTVTELTMHLKNNLLWRTEKYFTKRYRCNMKLVFDYINKLALKSGYAILQICFS